MSEQWCAFCGGLHSSLECIHYHPVMDSMDDSRTCANCSHGVSIHEWEDESTSCCLFAHKLFTGVGEGQPCMCPGFKRAVTPPKPLEPQRTHVPFTTSDVCWCQPFDGPMHPQCPMHGDKCQCKDGPCLSDDMLERGYVCASLTPPKPAHIDTTAPQVIRPELQMLEIDSSPKGPKFPFDIPDDDNGYKCEPTPSPIDTTGQEKAVDIRWNHDIQRIELRFLEKTSVVFVEHHHPENVVDLGPAVRAWTAPASIATTQGDAEPCIDCCEPGSTKETIEEQKIPYGQTGVVLTAYVPVFTCTKCDMQWTDWRGEGIREKVVAAYLAQPKPAPQAEAQESFESWFTDERADKYQYGAEGPARDAWNAQQAKIEALEQRVVELENLFGLPDENDPLCARLVNSGTFDPEVQRARSGGSIGDWMRRAETAESRVAELEEKLREGK